MCWALNTCESPFPPHRTSRLGFEWRNLQNKVLNQNWESTFSAPSSRVFLLRPIPSPFARQVKIFTQRMLVGLLSGRSACQLDLFKGLNVLRWIWYNKNRWRCVWSQWEYILSMSSFFWDQCHPHLLSKWLLSPIKVLSPHPQAWNPSQNLSNHLLGLSINYIDSRKLLPDSSYGKGSLPRWCPQQRCLTQKRRWCGDTCSAPPGGQGGQHSWGAEGNHRKGFRDQRSWKLW